MPPGLNVSIESSSSRMNEIVASFICALDKHLDDLKNGLVEEMYEVRYFAEEVIFINPTHLSDTIKAVTGRSACDLYQERIINIAKDLLSNTDKPVNSIAYQLTYDPSNFTKLFKKFTGLTPREYRLSSLQKI